MPSRSIPLQLLTSPTFPGPRAFTPKCTARAGGSPSFLVFFPREPGHILGASARVSFNVLSLPGRTGVALAVFGMRRSSRSPREASVQRRNVSLDTVHCDLRACYNALSLSAFVPRRCGEPPCPHRPQRFMPTTLLAWFLPPSLSPPSFFFLLLLLLRLLHPLLLSLARPELNGRPGRVSRALPPASLAFT